MADQTLITDPNTVKRLAGEHYGNFEVMRYQLQLDDDIDDEHLDAFVDAIAAPIISAIDCTECANCCRTLNVYLEKGDSERLADGLNIPSEQFMAQYVDQEKAAKEHEWGTFCHQPCAFLDGKRCAVYPHRPEACRAYPELTPDFRWMLHDTIQGSGICPIIYNVLIALLAEIDTYQRDNHKKA